MAIAQNIIIDQDSDYSQQFTAKTDAGVVIDLTNSTLTLSDIKTSTLSLSITLSIDPTIPPEVMTLSPLFKFSTISLCSLTFFCCGRIKKK